MTKAPFFCEQATYDDVACDCTRAALISVVLRIVLLTLSCFFGRAALAADNHSSQIRLAIYPGTVVAAWMQTIAHDLVLREALAKNGLHIELASYTSSKAVAAALTAGEIDVAPLPDIAVFNAVQNRSVTGIGMLALSYASVVSRSAAEPRDLIGQRIGIVSGTSSEKSLRRMLAAAHIRDQQVRLVEVPPANMLTALATGSIDAFSMWEPMSQRALQAHPEYRVLFQDASSMLLMMRNDILLKQPVIARELAAAFIRGFNWMRAQDRHTLQVANWAIATKGAGDIDNVETLDAVSTLHTSVTEILGLPLLPLSWNAMQGEGWRTFSFLNQNTGPAQEQRWQKLSQQFDSSLMQQVLQRPGRYRLEEFRYAD